MAKITDVKRKIDSLSPGEFQEFCDLLLRKRGLGLVHGYGMKSGTNRTTKGNPDTYFRTDIGKYVLANYTTQKSKLYKKIEEDIRKCLDKKETGININDIDEIICCHTSSNLSAGDDKQLRNLCSKKGINLTILGLDEIGYEVFYNYKSLIKDYLGLVIDTNQILTIDDFVQENDAISMSAPLKTDFIFREAEKNKIKNAVANSPIVIISGKAGVGKTRLVLEVAKEIEKEQGYKVLCVKNNNQGLYQDLVSSIERDERYLLFVDDANELGEFEQVVQYTSKEHSGYMVKVIATVRDYAKSNVISVSSKYCVPTTIEIHEFSDDEIKQFLNLNLGIKNQEYINQIIRISEGNARMAYMAGKLAVEKNNLNAISDASQLFDAYYGQYVNKTIGNDRNLCLAAGILSVINAITLDNLKVIEELLLTFGISESEFIDKIHYLEKLEVLEIKLENVAMLSDQCFANYMLYYVFFKRKLFSFAEVLKVGYKHFRNGVNRMINVILNIFESDETKTYCKKEILKVWDDFSKSKDKCFEDYVKDFHVFRPEESFLVVKSKIDAIDNEMFNVFEVDYKKNTFALEEELLGYLDGYQLSKYLKDAIELLIVYAGKKETMLVSGYKWLENNYGMKVYDHKYKFYNQNVISDVLISEISKGNQTAMSIGLQWASYLLSFIFESSELARGRKIYIYRFEIKDIEGVMELRSKCWNILQLLAKKEEWHVLLIKALDNYSKNLQGISEGNVVIGDVEYIDRLLLLLKRDDVSFIKVVYRITYYFKKLGVEYNEKWNSYLMGKEWELFKILENDYVTSELSYEEYKEERAVRLNNYGKKLKKDDIPSFMKSIDSIMSDPLISNCDYDINQGIETIIQEFGQQQLNESLTLILNNKVHANINPYSILKRLVDNDKEETLLNKLNMASFKRKNDWLYAYFDCISKEKANSHTLSAFMNFIRNDMNSEKEFGNRSLKVLDKFIVIQPDIYPLVCSYLFNKKEDNKSKVNLYFFCLFNEHIYSPNTLLHLFENDIILLQDIYFYMISQNSIADLNGTFLVSYLKLDEIWLERYTKIFLEHCEKRLDYDDQKNISLWKSDSYMDYFEYIFNYSMDKAHCTKIEYMTEKILIYGGKDSVVAEHQINWLNHMIKKYALTNKIVTIFKIVSKLDYEYRLEAFRIFLELNKKYDDFEKLQLIKERWFGNGSLIPAYKEDIEFLNALRDIAQGIDFIEHRVRIQKEVEMIQEMIEKEETSLISQNLFM